MKLNIGMLTAILTISVALATPVSAKTLVNCGSKGGAFIVDKVPVGCHSTTNSPPHQATNE